MLGFQRVSVKFMVTASLLALAVPCAAAPKATEQQSLVNNKFHAALVKVDAAQRELQNGRPEAFKALWSRADDITLSGRFGGTIELFRREPEGWRIIHRQADSQMTKMAPQ